MERILATVPKVGIKGMMMNEYAVLLTDQRVIFVLTKAPHVIAGALLGPTGVIVAAAAAKEHQLSLEGIDPRALADDPKNIAITYSTLKEVVFEHKWWDVPLVRLRHAAAKGKTREIALLVGPTTGYTKQRRAAGADYKTIEVEYRRLVRDAFLAALPQTIPRTDGWK